MHLAGLPPVAPRYAVGGWPIPRSELAIRIARANATGTPKVVRSGKYAAYLSSPGWRRKRMWVLAIADCVCYACKGHATEVHHRTYVRLGRERLEDLEPLCAACHAKQHDRTRPGTTQAVGDCLGGVVRDIEAADFAAKPDRKD